MFSNRLVLASILTGLTGASLFGCSNNQMVDPGAGNLGEEHSTKILKDKFFTDHKCAVYQSIDTFTCDGGIRQLACKDAAGNVQIDFYLRDQTNPDLWYSSADIDAQIADLTAKLADANAKKAAFGKAQASPTTLCSLD